MLQRILLSAAVCTVVVLAPFYAHAGTLRAGSVVCLTLPYLNKYERHLARGEDAFTRAMRERAQCVIKPRAETVSLITHAGSYVHLELVDGFRVFTTPANYVVEAGEAPPAPAPAPAADAPRQPSQP